MYRRTIEEFVLEGYSTLLEYIVVLDSYSESLEAPFDFIRSETEVKLLDHVDLVL